VDAIAAVASLKRVSFVKHTAADQTFALTDLYHPGVEASKRVLNSVVLGESVKSHILLTGPNRGGKSTLLKSLGAAVLMSQTLGIVFARRATLPVFRHIVTALSPTDTLGKMSLFEAEIEFAKEVRGRMTDGTPMFLMMDEIFHGTNAHDGVEASQIFLDDLYGLTGNVVSVVSTHYMELPERYKDTVALRCMEASVDPTDGDRLLYTYRLTEGVNRCSSVREILRERGLLGCGHPDEKTPVSASKV
jgi:DNA mismatch repair ATPase MutS